MLLKDFQTLKGGKINKVNQPEKDELILGVFAQRKTYSLLMSVNSNANRIHLTNKSFENPKIAFNFCMLLRKHLTNGTIVEITQMPFERVLDFEIATKNDLGYESTVHLLCEFTGKTANVILTDERYTIFDCLKHLPQNIDADRVFFAGGKYQFFTPQNKISPFDFDKIENLLNSNTDLFSLLKNNLLGVCKNTLVEILWGVEDLQSPLMRKSMLIERLKSFKENMDNPKPHVVLKDGQIFAVCPFDFDSIQGEKIYFETLSQAHDEFYFVCDKEQRFRTKAKSINIVIKNAIARTEKKIGLQMQTLLSAQDYEKYKKYGELILANIHLISKNANFATVVDYYDENCPTLTIELDKSLSPQKNAQKYFKKYQKLKNSIAYTTPLLEQSKKQLEYLKTVKTNLSFCYDNEDLLEITNELVLAGLIKEQKETKHSTQKSSLLKYVIDGFDVYVGKNNVQNDYLTFKFAKPSDLWIHTQNVHSSHCIIVNPDKVEIPESVIVTVAEICVFYSQARNGTKIEVAYTQKKNVKKPSGAPLGFVNYSSYYTVVVNSNAHNELLF